VDQATSRVSLVVLLLLMMLLQLLKQQRVKTGRHFTRRIFVWFIENVKNSTLKKA
jgi:hypothetical protein